MKRTLDELQDEMLDLYQRLQSGEVNVKTGSEMNNAMGKILKAEALKHVPAQLALAREKLELAREIFETNRTVRLISDIEQEELEDASQ